MDEKIFGMQHPSAAAGTLLEKTGKAPVEKPYKTL